MWRWTLGIASQLCGGFATLLLFISLTGRDVSEGQSALWIGMSLAAAALVLLHFAFKSTFRAAMRRENPNAWEI